ncbi:YkgJ family cysteine cluster protein [Dehalogenimonas sp. THU2]|uniref:YkgJ family cysteine cluster protein n=1 Tax=Dehalogenimonas sp. THU2 TaxID=3151121 RepID=UPI003218A0B4
MERDNPALTCFCCGVCCSKYQVQMPLEEAHRIAATLGIGWEEFQREYLDPAWPGVRTVLVRHAGGHCLFLERQPDERVFFCRIQAFKPASCIEWQADLSKQDCREGLASWHLCVGATGCIEGAPSDIEEFDALIDALTRS